MNSQIRSRKSPITVKNRKSQNIACHLSVCLLVRTKIWGSLSHGVDQWVVRARLILINRPIYNSSVWDSSSSLHLSSSLGSDSCLAAIHSLEGRAAIRLLTAWLGFPELVRKSAWLALFLQFVLSLSCHIHKPCSSSTCLHFSVYVKV